MPSIDLVLFAIRAGVRLGYGLRQAYIESTKGRALVLPLPDFDFAPNVSSALNFFSSPGTDYVTAGSRLEELHLKALEATLDDAERAEYLALYEETFALDRVKGRARRSPAAGAPVPSPEDDALLAALEVRQWQRDDAGNPHTLHRVVGTIIEIGIDYFASVPGAVRRDSREGKVLGAFVDALEKVLFSDMRLDEGGVRDLVGSFFVAALEVVADQPELVSSDATVRELVEVSARGLSRDVAVRLAGIEGDEARRDRLKSWSELVFRSLLSTAGRRVVSEPSRFLGIDDAARGKLVTNVGTSFIDLALDDEELDLRRVFGREALERVIAAALETVGEHPELLEISEEGIRTIVAEVAGMLAGEENLLSPDIAPEVARLVIEKTAKNIELIWPDPGGRPEDHVLLAAARRALEVLGREPEGGRWTLRFGSEEVLEVVDAVLDEVASHPAWLVELAEDVDANLGAALEAVLSVLRERADNRLGPDTAAAVLSAAVRAIALRREFLEETPGARPLVAAIIDTVVAALFADGVEARARWQLLSSQALTLSVEIVLERFARSALPDDALERLEESLEGLVETAASGAAVDWEAFADDLTERLAG